MSTSMCAIVSNVAMLLLLLSKTTAPSIDTVTAEPAIFYDKANKANSSCPFIPVPSGQSVQRIFSNGDRFSDFLLISLRFKWRPPATFPCCPFSQDRKTMDLLYSYSFCMISSYLLRINDGRYSSLCNNCLPELMRFLFVLPLPCPNMSVHFSDTFSFLLTPNHNVFIQIYHSDEFHC